MDPQKIENTPAGHPVKPRQAHLFSVHPDPKAAVTIRKILLGPALGFLFNILAYCILPTAMLDGYQFAKFYAAASVASAVVNVPLYVRLRMASANPEFYYVGFGPTPQPGDRPSCAAEWQPRRITDSAKLRYIIPLVIVAALWLLSVGIFVVFDIPPWARIAWRESGHWRSTLPIWTLLLSYLAAWSMYGLLLIFTLSLSIPFFVQARICYNCVLEKQGFIALDITRDVLTLLDEESAARDVSDLTLVDTK